MQSDMSGKNMKADEGEESDWSLDSLEDLKGLSLNELRAEQLEEVEPSVKVDKKVPVVSYPPLQELGADSQMHLVGRVTCKVGELYIVEVDNMTNIVDLDNWLFDSKRQLVGFVIDIFGRVDKPFYAVKLKQGHPEQNLLNQQVYFGDGCKTLTEDDIKSIRAKSSVDLDGGQDSSEDEDLDNNTPNNMNSLPNYPQHANPNKRRRRSFEEEPMHERERTRQKKNKPRYEPYNNNQRGGAGFNNQSYLENMYSTYYNQMMQLYQQGQMPPPIAPQQFNQYQPQQSFSNQPFPTVPTMSFPPLPTVPTMSFPQQLPNPSQFPMHQGNRPPFPPQ